MKKVLLIAVRIYQVWLGPLLGGACRYYPSCSHYALEAIERHGARRGAGLAARRVLRCHPFSPGGIDLVPEVEAADRGARAIPASGNLTAAPTPQCDLAARSARRSAEPARSAREEFAR